MIKRILKIIFALIAILTILDVAISAHVNPIQPGIELCFYMVSLFAIFYIIFAIIKNLNFSRLLILFLGYVVFVLMVPMKPTYNQYDCINDAICAEGLEINTEYGLIKVNEENCLKYNWKWDNKSKTCNMKD